MDVKDMLKFQFVSGMTNNGGSMNHTNGMNDQSHYDKIISMICQAFFMLLIGFADELSKVFPLMLAAIKNHIKNKIGSSGITQSFDNLRQVPISEQAVALTKRHFTNCVSMTRLYEDSTSKDKRLSDKLDEMNGMIDAILSTVAKQENVPSLKLINTSQLMINYKDNPIQLTSEIYLKLDEVNVSPEGLLSSITLTLMSNTESAAEISKYMRKIYEQHQEELRNALGDTIYYFDQKSRDGGPRGDPRGDKATPEDLRNRKQMMIQSSPKTLSFTKAPFVSNKTFSNIFGERVREIEKRVRFFIDNKKWYDSRGIPYQLGLMMSGIPGSGKTSVIRAIANLTGRHIINVNFGNIMSATQLKSLFQSEKLNVYTDGSCSELVSFHIPIDQRIYVLEEIDTVGDIVRQRSSCSSNTSPLHDEVTLGEILTVLDGTMETPGRLVIMTSNHPELLDDALVRPGRIDMMVTFTKASRRTIAEMFTVFFDRNLEDVDIERLPDGRLTPAEVGQVLFRHFSVTDDDFVEDVVDDLMKTAGAIEKASLHKLELLAASDEQRSEASSVDRERSECDEKQRDVDSTKDHDVKAIKCSDSAKDFPTVNEYKKEPVAELGPEYVSDPTPRWANEYTKFDSLDANTFPSSGIAPCNEQEATSLDSMYNTLSSSLAR